MTRAIADLGGTSRQSLAAARVALDAALKGKQESEAAKFAAELFAVLAALDSSAPLRRALTDASRDAKDKAKLVTDLFAKSGGDVLSILTRLVEVKWSKPSDLANAIEQLAVEAEATSADLAGSLDRLEEELFGFSKVISADSELLQALNSNKYSAEGKRVLVAKLFGGKVAPATSRMLGHLVSGLRGRNLEGTIADYIKATAARRERTIATVTSAIALTDTQREKLAAALAAKIGQKVRLNVEVDPTVMGGISIRFADELIDATIVNRLADASRALAG
ncbi:MAG: F0F1 ATP synthase subunit delta [Actinomycetota bacterium]